MSTECAKAFLANRSATFRQRDSDSMTQGPAMKKRLFPFEVE
jgi:hypothetical protein